MRAFARLSVLVLIAALLGPALAAGSVVPRDIGGGILPPPPTCRGIFPGDANDDGTINISDVVYMVNFLCHDGEDIDPLANGDVNADCAIDLDDVYYLIDYIFKGGPAPMDCVCGEPAIGGCEVTCDIVTEGDANGDGDINISDVVFLINMLCHDGPPPSPLGNGDVNADCVMNLDDVYYLIDYIFKGGPAPQECQCGAPTIGGCEATCGVVTVGDANSDGSLDISDVVFLVNLLCHDGPPPSPLGNGDVNADCIIDMGDVMYLVAYIFEGGPAPQDCVCGAPTIGTCQIDCDGVLPGDANSDGTINISDAVFLVNFLCHDGPAPDPLGNGDVNGDCIIDMRDIEGLIGYMFEGGPAPADCVCGNPAVGECELDKAADIDRRTKAEGVLDDRNLPTRFGLWRAQPNPFNPKTSISFSLPVAADVRLDIYNLAGEKVRTLVNETYGAGVHNVVWNGTDDAGATVSAGVYLYAITAGEWSQTRKMMLIK